MRANLGHREPAVYIMASGRNGTLYVGVTSDLRQRVADHQAGSFGGFTAQYNVKTLVHVEWYPTMQEAISREKRLKGWRREWKLRLVEEQNPQWDDLARDLT